MLKFAGQTTVIHHEIVLIMLKKLLNIYSRWWNITLRPKIFLSEERMRKQSNNFSPEPAYHLYGTRYGSRCSYRTLCSFLKAALIYENLKCDKVKIISNFIYNNAETFDYMTKILYTKLHICFFLFSSIKINVISNSCMSHSCDI